MKRWPTVLGLLCVVLLAGFYWWQWKQDEPRRRSLACLAELDTALHSSDPSTLLDLIALPSALQGRTRPEQTEFLTKALRDEVSAEGLAVLKREGTFGPLTNIFPAEAEAWAKQAGVKPEDCVAFKMEKNGLRAEVVLASGQKAGANSQKSSVISHQSSVLRVVRLNNVKQLADTNFSTPNSRQ